MDLLFSVASTVVLPAWLALALAPAHRWTQRAAAYGVPALLGAAYVAVLVVSWVDPGPGTGGGFGSLDEVAALFSDRRALLAGWIHYLAFDLFVGAWEARDADRAGVPRWALVPCLALTFLLGPVGFLLYLVARAVSGRSASLGAPAP